VLAPFASAAPYETWIVPHEQSPVVRQLGDDCVRPARRSGDPRARRDPPGMRRSRLNLMVVSADGADGVDGVDAFHWFVRIVPKLTTPAGFELASGMNIKHGRAGGRCGRAPERARAHRLMAVVLTGSDLEPEDLERVARAGDPVSLDEAAAARMRVAREVVERSLERSDEVYGLTTGVGAAKTNKVEAEDAAATSRRLVRAHRVAQGPVLPRDVVRAAVPRARDRVRSRRRRRPARAGLVLIDALNADRVPAVRSLGSVGQADLAPPR
jgi:hypothetical protein